MKPYAKKLLLTAAVAVGLFSATQNSNAANNADVPVRATTRNAIVVTKDTDMDFGQLDVIIATQTGDVILRAATGLVDVTGTSSTVTETGTPVAGQVSIDTDGVSPIVVTCTAGTMEDAAADSLAVTALTIYGSTGNTTAETDCITPAVVTPTAETVVLKVGSRITLGGANLVATGNKLYDSAVGGTAPNISVAYQ